MLIQGQPDQSLWPQGKPQTSQPCHNENQQNFLLPWRNILQQRSHWRPDNLFFLGEAQFGHSCNHYFGHKSQKLQCFFSTSYIIGINICLLKNDSLIAISLQSPRHDGLGIRGLPLSEIIVTLHFLHLHIVSNHTLLLLLKVFPIFLYHLVPTEGSLVQACYYLNLKERVP